ncbi:MAG: type IV pilus modification protein PilV [Thiogranum sp.]|nr:type IV pilus modification protein PilV [Thiogranum sp.]
MTTVAINRTQSARGFTLIEILVSVLILSIGLLGLASLQANGLKNNYGAYARSQAIILANDMADRIRANPTAASSGLYNSILTPASDPGCKAGNCSPTEIRDHDSANWYTSLQTMLPAGTGTVTGNGTLFTITVRWDERTGATGTGCNPQDPDDMPCFITTFMP